MKKETLEVPISTLAKEMQYPKQEIYNANAAKSTKGMQKSLKYIKSTAMRGKVDKMGSEHV